MRLDVGKAQFVQVDSVYEGIDHPDHIVLGDHFVQWGSEKAKLLAVLSGSVCHVFIGCTPGGGDASKIIRIRCGTTIGVAFFHNLTFASLPYRRA